MLHERKLVSVAKPQPPPPPPSRRADRHVTRNVAVFIFRFPRTCVVNVGYSTAMGACTGPVARRTPGATSWCGMLCPPRARGEALLMASRPAGVCLHWRRLYLCSACGGGGLCSHGRRRATCVLCGPPLASALCALHQMERRDRCPCRRSPATADAGGRYGLPGAACPSFTAVEPTAQVRLRTPLLSLAGQEAFGRATADQRQDARLVTSVARYRSVLSAQARRPSCGMIRALSAARLRCRLQPPPRACAGPP